MENFVLEELLKTPVLEDSSSSSSDSSLLHGDSSDDDKDRIKRTNVELFVEKIVSLYSEVEFKSHFRMNRQSVRRLCDEAIIEKQNIGGWPEISKEKCVLMTLWYLANTETFRQISDRFNVTLSASYTTIKLVSGFLMNNSKKYIKWPPRQKYKSISDEFKKKKRLPFVIGCIDGTHIEINRPRKNQESYYNRKGYHSILLQGIVTHNMLFTNIYCGEPGSIHDARLLRKSDIYKKARADHDFFGDYYLLGDSAYPALNWIVPPFKDNGHLSQQQKDFNFMVSSLRIVVEHAFGLLKGRFRRLTRFENRNIDFIIQCVVSSVVLHNLCLLWDDIGEEFLLQEAAAEPDNPNLEVENCVETRTRQNEIFNLLFPQ